MDPSRKLVVVRTSLDLDSQVALIGGDGGESTEIQHPCHSFDPQLESLLAKRGQEPAFFEYAGVKVLKRRSTGFPNATFNHFAIARALTDHSVTPRRFIDLGCGVGFLGNYASVHFRPEEIVFADLNPDALNHGLLGYEANHGVDLDACPRTPHSFGFKIKTLRHTLDARLGNAAHTLRGYEADVAVAAPMYIPGVCEVFPQAYALFAGIAKQLGTHLFIGHSCLATHMVESAARSCGMRMDTRYERLLPLRLDYADDAPLSQVQRDSGILFPEVEESLSSLGLDINTSNNGLPRYYHRVFVSELRDK